VLRQNVERALLLLLFTMGALSEFVPASLLLLFLQLLHPVLSE
jgi:hypothetical protein